MVIAQAPVRQLKLRAEEIAKLKERLERGRLLTLVGPPGVGKTWLAEQAQATLADATFFDLTRATDDNEVWPVCASALGLVGDGDQQELVLQLLAERGPGLFILDNAEHVLAGARHFVEALLEVAPEHRILVTSRQALGIKGESTLIIAPFSDEDGTEFLLQCAEDAGVEPLPSAAQAADIVRVLDGLPLALELAAPRLRVLSTTELTLELKDRFGVLSPVGRGRSLDVAIASSWDRLPVSLQAAAQALSMFRGGFNRAAAAGMLKDAPERPLDVLQALVDRSLLSTTRRNESTRFRFLESIAAFIGQTLSDERRLLCEGEHAEVMVAVGEALTRTRTRAAFEELALEVDNLLVAVTRVGDRAPALGVRLVMVLDELTTAGRGGWHHGVLLGSAVDWSERGSVRSLGQVLAARARYRFWSGGYADVERDARRAISLAVEVGDSYLAGRALFALALLEAAARNPDSALALLAQAEPGYRAGNDEALLAKDLARVAFELARQGICSEASTLIEKARSLSQELAGSTLPAAEGFLCLARGQAERALGRFAEGRDVARKSGFELERIPAEIGRAIALQLLGEPAAAARGAHEAALLCEAAGSVTAAALCSVVGAQAAWIGGLDGVDDALSRAAAVAERFGAQELIELVAVTRALLDLAEGREPEAASLSQPSATLIDVLVTLVVEGEPSSDETANASANESATHQSGDPLPRALDAFSSLQMRALLAVLTDEVRRRAGGGEGASLLLGLSPDATTVVGPEGKIDLSTRPVLRRVLLALAKSHKASPGRPVLHDALVAAGWPSEKILPDAARRRLQVTISMLRRLGLRAVIETDSDGYRFAPAVVLSKPR